MPPEMVELLVRGGATCQSFGLGTYHLEARGATPPRGRQVPKSMFVKLAHGGAECREEGLRNDFRRGLRTHTAMAELLFVDFPFSTP